MKFWKIWKILLLAFIFIPLLAWAGSAVELQVLIIGQGYVQGDGLTCTTRCVKTYDKGTVVHMKAISYPDFRFVGWRIAGESHTGILTLEHDTVLTAIFERETADPMLADGITIYWYDGNGGRDYAKIGLREMVIQLKDLEESGLSTESAYQAALEEVRQTFHPQAEIGTGDPTLLYVESLEPLERSHWFEILRTIQDFPYVEWAGPTLYRDIEVASTQLMVWNEIYVEYPESYTEAQIIAIEHDDYGLIRLESLGFPNSFAYQVASPLEDVETANRLYESGLVEWSQPAIPINAVPLSEPNDELFKQQWHLKNRMAGYTGEDINVLPAWENGYKGSGVVIAVVDNGVEFVHPDLGPNKKLPEDFHQDFIEGAHDPIDNNTGKLTCCGMDD